MREPCMNCITASAPGTQAQAYNTYVMRALHVGDDDDVSAQYDDAERFFLRIFTSTQEKAEWGRGGG